jgi:hypothetical protein
LVRIILVQKEVQAFLNRVDVRINGAGMGFSCGTGLANASSESKFHLS